MPRRDTGAPRARWPWLSLLPIGLGAWVPVYAGVRARVRSWVALGVLWCAAAIGGWALAIATGSHSHSALNSAGGFLLIASWVGGAATTFTIRSDYERRIDSQLESAEERARARLRDRAHALQLAQANPALAKEMGVGRPDLPGAADAGLIDVNSASEEALTRLPGVYAPLAKRITAVREEVGGFSSAEDLGIALDLPGDLVERLRDRAVFLPR